jgi:DNA (cytosine-5)-methyltransferase 1
MAKSTEGKLKNPAPAKIRAARLKSGLTQIEAAALINCEQTTWFKWESGERKMHPAFWELFIIKTSV